MKRPITRAWFRSQASQSMTEFAMIAAPLLLMIFGIIDFGRLMYIYGTLVQAANEGARVAIRASTPLPNNADVLSATRTQAQSLQLGNPCANGPVPPRTGPGALNPAPGSGWVFITQPNPPATTETAPPPNAPGGEPNKNVIGTCSAIRSESSGNYPLEVTVRYNYPFFTPLLEQLQPTIVLQSFATLYTEY